jgi:nucleoside-diphosphate-sugar epimerase
MVLESPTERVAGQVFNVGDTAENFRKTDLVRMIKDRVPGGEVLTVHRDEDPRDYRVSFERIRSHLGYTITRRVTDGVGEIATALEAGLIEDPTSPAHYNVSP